MESTQIKVVNSITEDIKLATFDELIKQVNANLGQQRDRGTAFEKIVVSYLKNEPLYKHKFENVWMLNEVPAQYHVPKKDLGVDIVAKDFEGKLTAVQAKFYKGKVGKDTINSFLAEMGKDYYSAGILVSTSTELNKNAQAAMQYMTKPVTIIGLNQLKNADIDWQKFSFAKENNDLSNKTVKKPRRYQKEAIEKSVAYFKDHNRGKLIMAPGTGKTFTSLKITEALMKEQHRTKFNVLYLVPSIQLLSQTLFSWNDDVAADINITSLSVVSDRKANQRKNNNDDDLGAKDIGFEPTTNVDELMNHYRQLQQLDLGRDMTVVFSTYQSIDVIKNAQEKGYPEFDLIIADEAHRTTGATRLGDDTAFTEVHSNNNVKGKLRLYQTATPKIYDQNSKKKAEQNSIVVSSMDDENTYGQEIYRLGFGDAVTQGYLTDYKVMVLAISESYVNKDMQQMLAADNQLKVDDIGKIIGVWNAMVKRDGLTGEIQDAPMKRAIAFTDTIRHSKIIANEFETVVNNYLTPNATNSYQVDVHHVDGGLNALQKEDEINWLADEEIKENHARVLSNVRFLTEGIDVPNLDGIIFFSPKKSQIDIVQAVGRIMRKYEGKEYGYIILPIVVADKDNPDLALNNDKKYQAVWQVLNALRSTDERFEAEVNKLDLNKKKSGRVNFIGVNSSPDDDVTEKGKREHGHEQLALALPQEWKQMQDAFYGKVVKHVGDRRYLEDWSEDVAEIAKMYILRINDLIASNVGAKAAFDKFITSLRYNINNSIDQDQAIQMLAQHLITEPVFDALFGDYSFVQNNVVSRSINDVISTFKVFGFTKETEKLKPFYDSIKLRASGIDNAAGKQKLIVTLYEKFFKKGFEKTTEAMGIVFTPIEVVDFIIHSVDDSLKKYFNKSLADENVHILDPFVGTGTFITRTLQYLKVQMDQGKISYDDILRKYMHELHANEIVLLSYYIAAINIETVFDEVNGPDHGYIPFDGIVLTDTFESTERERVLNDDMFDDNDHRLKEQMKQPITVIISNPPYSVGQKNANDDNQNVHYPKLEDSLKKSYVNLVEVQNKNSLYDSYIKAFRWASDRLGKKGIIGFVTNGSYIDSRSAAGIRKSFYEEFNYIYIFNLRGNARTSGERRRQEKDNIFGQGTRTPIAISILIKDGSDNHQIFYHDIGDYLSKKEKINIIKKFSTILNQDMDWDKIEPDNYNDWINQRNEEYSEYVPIYSKNSTSIYLDNTTGITTARDAWVTGFSKQNTINNVQKLITNYKHESIKINKNYKSLSDLKNLVNKDRKYIKWDDDLLQELYDKKSINYNPKKIKIYMYRPFTKKWIYYDNAVIQRSRKFDKINVSSKAPFLYTTGIGSQFFSSIITDLMVDKGLMSSGQGYYFENSTSDESLLRNNINYSNINSKCFKNIEFSDIELVEYVYALLQSSEYRYKYKNNIIKEVTRIPIVKNKEKYIEIGKKLMELHLNYEEVPVYNQAKIIYNGEHNYKVKKMKFSKRSDDGSDDRSTIIFNDNITISNIPDKAYKYIVNGRSAIEWIMDQYQIKTDKGSGITDDPNDFSDDPKYIFNLLLRIINVSVQTVDLINELPHFEVDE